MQFAKLKSKSDTGNHHRELNDARIAENSEPTKTITIMFPYGIEANVHASHDTRIQELMGNVYAYSGIR